MLPSFCRQTVTRIRPGEKELRGSKDPDWDPAKVDRLEIKGCSVQPATTTLSEDGRVLGITEQWTAYLPEGSDIKAGDHIEFDGDKYYADGTVERRYGVVDLGTLTWNVININVFYADVSGKAVNNANIICSNYTNAGVYENYNNFADKTIASSASVYRIAIKDSAYTDAAAFKTAMSGVMLVYELATPTTETSTPFTNPQICDPDGTEEYVTNNGIPVGHETSYQL